VPTVIDKNDDILTE